MLPEITKIVGTKFAFKIFMDKFNATKLLPVFNVMRMSADNQIIETLHANATPVKVLILYLFELHLSKLRMSIIMDGSWLYIWTFLAAGHRSYKFHFTRCHTIGKFV